MVPICAIYTEHWIALICPLTAWWATSLSYYNAVMHGYITSTAGPCMITVYGPINSFIVARVQQFHIAI